MPTILHRRGTAAEWTAADPVLGSGEKGVELDTGYFKIGNGLLHWNTLPYFTPGHVSSDLVTAHVNSSTGVHGIPNTAVLLADVASKAPRDNPSFSGVVTINEALQIRTKTSNYGLGLGAHEELTTGIQNNAVGEHAQTNLQSGHVNNSFGVQTHRELVDGSGNQAMGYAAGIGLTSGNFNTHLGHGTGNSLAQSPTVNGSVAIGADHTGIGAYTETDNTIVLGTPLHKVVLRNEQEFVSPGKGLILTSPNGTRYRLTVTDDGYLTVNTA